VTDRHVLYATALVRALATGTIGVLLGIFLGRRGFDPTQTGVIISAGLAGAAAAALVVTLAGDRLGRRRTLVAISLLGAVGAVVLASAANLMVIAAAAFLGMVNGMGRDRGAALILDQSILPSTVTAENRTSAFAWYNVMQDLGHAAGALLAGLPVLLRRHGAVGELESLRVTVLVYGGLVALTGLAYLRLSPAAEATGGTTQPARSNVSPESRRILWRISSLFALDSLGGGFLTAALLAVFFYQRFGISEAGVGLLFFAARVANALSHLGAAWLARRIGLVNTMVFTHIPSSLLLVTVALAPSFWVAAVFFLLREGLVEMDVPTRQSYVMAVVQPEERTFASGVTHLVRLAAWAVAPAFAGLLMQGASLWVPLVVGAGLKVSYDVLLYLAFRRVKPPEETAA
jgi:MFS family permease